MKIALGKWSYQALFTKSFIDGEAVEVVESPG
jgi:hypothetical protein